MYQKNNKMQAQAMRAQRRTQDDALRATRAYGTAQENKLRPAGLINNSANKLKITFLGGLADVGEKNMAVFEYGDDALVLDCGHNLGVDLPGINYEICDTTYLESIAHKLKAYVVTHGHLDHIGGLRHIVPKFPAPIYGSRYTIGVVEKLFNDEVAMGGSTFVPDLVGVGIDDHQVYHFGQLGAEFIRVTHAIPDPAAICISSPVGQVIATGDFRLDPEPLDKLPSDTTRLRELGDQGVLALLSDSSYADEPGRTPTEHTLQKSFSELIERIEGRIFVAVFSSNINRTQMIINAAVAAGRKVALDGRSMLVYAEIAVRQGILKVPKGTIIPMSQAAGVPTSQLLVMCTGGQGEPNAALSRMSEGAHKYVNLKKGDTVLISSSPIPGNEIRYDQLGNLLTQKGVTLFRHPTHELDGCGPLHVSGHARRDEHREMLDLVRPKYFIPVHGGTLRRKYHAQIGVEQGMSKADIFLPENGDCLYFSSAGVELGGQVPHGSRLIDQSGRVVEGIVVRDRVTLGQNGILTVMVSLSKRSGQLVSSPDIISRGFISLRDNEVLMSELRREIVQSLGRKRDHAQNETLRATLREEITAFLFARTGVTPLVIVVVNKIAGATHPARTTPAVASTVTR